MKNYTMRRLLTMVLCALIASVMLSGPVSAATVTASWDSPTEYCSGQALPPAAIAGYRVWWGDAARGQFDALPGNPTPPLPSLPSCDTSTFLQFSYPNVVDAGNVNTLVVDVGESGQERTLYFSVTAYDTTGNESVYSAEGSVVIPPTPVAPAPPASLTVILQ